MAQESRTLLTKLHALRSSKTITESIKKKVRKTTSHESMYFYLFRHQVCKQKGYIHECIYVDEIERQVIR